jgi:hypothetical protein
MFGEVERIGEEAWNHALGKARSACSTEKQDQNMFT